MRLGSRRGTPADLVVVGLGNPGPDYALTRHNVGAEVAECLATRHGGRMKLDRSVRTLCGDVRIGPKRVTLAFPQTYMNDSGVAVAGLVRRAGLWEGSQLTDPLCLVVIHDELDLPTGRVKVKVGGGTAGHNGLKSVQAHVHTPGFVRVRVGIGRPPGRQSGADYVLHRPSKADRILL
ncbi:MAG: aminoacyl-tRNA hydrolase, partial [Acidimicrobiales bacterium]